MAITAPPAGIFKAYDIRGVYGEELDAETAHLIGRAFARVLARIRGKDSSELRVGLGHDMRLSSPDMAAAVRKGLVEEGATVLDAGQVATEMSYFLVGSRELDGGAMVTASHNPKRYTGVKLLREGALALSGDAGIQDVRTEIEGGLPDPPGGGSVEEVDIYPDFHEHMLASIEADAIGPLRILADGSDGMAGPMVGPLLDRLNLEVTTSRWEPNGDFPEAGPNPFLEENRRMLVEQVKKGGFDLAIAWDGDADRCFFIDDLGSFCDGDFVCALLARATLAKEPGATILYDPRSSRAVPDTVAVFGGEVSGHYYFRHFYCADSGTMPALLMLELVSREDRSLSELMDEFRSKYFISGEINSEVADQQAKMEEIAERYSDGAITRLDGVSVDYPDWHFNVRPSNTEPLLRLNLESLISREQMEQKRDEVLTLIQS
jgi:phosphomannomutase